MKYFIIILIALAPAFATNLTDDAITYIESNGYNYTPTNWPKDSSVVKYESESNITLGTLRQCHEALAKTTLVSNIEPIKIRIRNIATFFIHQGIPSIIQDTTSQNHYSKCNIARIKIPLNLHNTDIFISIFNDVFNSYNNQTEYCDTYSATINHGTLDEVAAAVINAINSRDTVELLSLTSDTFFEYFQADIDAANYPDSIQSDYYQLNINGFYPYEYDYIQSNKKRSVAIFGSVCSFFTRSKYPLDFKPVNIISNNRAEIRLNHICDADFIHLIFIKQHTKWFFTGWFFEAAMVR